GRGSGVGGLSWRRDSGFVMGDSGKPGPPASASLASRPGSREASVAHNFESPIPKHESRPSMRIISFNANGIRSATDKGFFRWFAKQKADVLCLQETKAQEHQLAGKQFLPKGYRAYFRDASTKKGYSGVAIYSTREPDEVRTALGWEAFDEEGRYLEARFGN